MSQCKCKWIWVGLCQSLILYQGGDLFEKSGCPSVGSKGSGRGFANAIILYGLVASKQHKNHVLIVNQNVLDLFSSIFLIVDCTVRFFNVRLTGLLGYLLCTILMSDVLVWCGITGSTINLASITIERYLKVVHSVWSNNKLRNWMINSAAAFAWIFSAVFNLALMFPTTNVMDGACYPYMIVRHPLFLRPLFRHPIS